MAAPKVLAISGGVGGAKLALGLARILPPESLAVIANTGDDFEHLGLHISPDLDTVMYALAGLADRERGWGLEGDTWHCLGQLRKLGGDDWFALGDRDLAIHLYRTRRLAGGATLSAVTEELCRHLGVRQRLLPMSDDPVRTLVDVAGRGEMAFQHYFVKERCEPKVRGFRFEGIAEARPAAPMMAWLGDESLGAIVLCPSNPFVSLDPVLGLPGVREAMRASPAPVVAVSPIVGGAALKGPAAKMMGELGLPVSATAVAAHYRGLADGFVLDMRDVKLAAGIERDLAMKARATPSIMHSLAEREALAREVLGFAHELGASSQ